ncbi:MAG TPA: TlpA disulfide reductase family protein [Acidimicrobiales bacterium]|nr:TlpA disulfide reductase family protein [Acidimicrobiales bacterium]
MLTTGDKAPSFRLVDITSGQEVTDPWSEGQVLLAFFKTSCPVCKMVAPMLTKLSEAGVRVVAVGEDPPEDLTQYADEQGQRVSATLTEPAPYAVSEAFGLESVPSVFLVGPDGAIENAIGGWSRDTWNALAESVGAPPVSAPDDGLRPFRPG